MFPIMFLCLFYLVEMGRVFKPLCYLVYEVCILITDGRDIHNFPFEKVPRKLSLYSLPVYNPKLQLRYFAFSIKFNLQFLFNLNFNHHRSSSIQGLTGHYLQPFTGCRRRHLFLVARKCGRI